MEISPDVQTLGQSAPLTATLLTEKAEVLGQKPVPLPLHPPQTSNRLSCGRTRTFGVGVPAINRLSHDTACKETVEVIVYPTLPAFRKSGRVPGFDH